MSEPDEPGKPALHYSISVRVRRTVTEEVHVLVPVTDEVVTDDHLDGDKVFAAAIRIGLEQSHEWRREGEPTVEIHPLQTPPPHLAADRA
jgi:hypothetical protein